MVIEATANAFLHHMVRNIAGLLIRIGKGEAPPSWAAEVLAGRDRRMSAATAPADGLYFWQVRYPAAFAAVPTARARLPGRYRAMIRDPILTPRPAGLSMSWFEKIMPSRIKTERRTRSVPEGLWIKCPACDAVLYRAELERNLYVCPKCSHHMRIGARERLRAVPRSRPRPRRSARGITPEDPLKFQRQQALQGPPGAGAEGDRGDATR